MERYSESKRSKGQRDGGKENRVKDCLFRAKINNYANISSEFRTICVEGFLNYSQGCLPAPIHIYGIT